MSIKCGEVLYREEYKPFGLVIERGYWGDAFYKNGNLLAIGHVHPDYIESHRDGKASIWYFPKDGKWISDNYYHYPRTRLDFNYIEDLLEGLDDGRYMETDKLNLEHDVVQIYAFLNYANSMADGQRQYYVNNVHNVVLDNKFNERVGDDVDGYLIKRLKDLIN